MFGSFGRYTGKGNGDSAFFLSAFDGQPHTVDRKTGTPPTIFIPCASLSVAGGTQPNILKRLLAREHLDSGLSARFLFCWPPRKAKVWSKASIDPAAEAELDAIFEKLFALKPVASNGDGAIGPGVVRLSPDAEALWEQYFNRNSVEHTELEGEMAAAWAKLEQYAARLALGIHLFRWAAGEVTDQWLLDADSMRTGIALAKWFKAEARRVYALLHESQSEEDTRKLVEWIARQSGSVTARKVQQGCRWLKGKGMAEAALEGLVAAGIGMLVETPSASCRGRPTTVFVLNVNATGEETPPPLIPQGVS